MKISNVLELQENYRKQSNWSYSRSIHKKEVWKEHQFKVENQDNLKSPQSPRPLENELKKKLCCPRLTTRKCGCNCDPTPLKTKNLQQKNDASFILHSKLNPENSHCSYKKTR